MGGSRKAGNPERARKRSESRQRTVVVALRLLPHERDALADTARSRGISLSELIRSGAMQASGLTAGHDEPPSA